MVNNMESKTYEERISDSGLWTLEERRNRDDLIELFKMFKQLSGGGAISKICSRWIRKVYGAYYIGVTV